MPEIPLRADSIAPPIEEEADATRPTVGEASRYRGCEEPFEPATETRRSRRGTDGVTCACRSVPCQYRACSVNTVPVLSILWLVLSILWLVLSIPCLFCQYCGAWLLFKNPAQDIVIANIELGSPIAHSSLKLCTPQQSCIGELLHSS